MINFIINYFQERIRRRREFEASGKIHPITGVKMFPCGRAYVGMFRMSGYAGYKARGRSWLVHIHMAELFVPNPENKPIVNHKDGNKMNFAADNLEWATHSENTKHAFMTGLCRATLTPDLVREIRKSELSTTELAKKHGVCRSTMHKVVNHQSWVDVK